MASHWEKRTIFAEDRLHLSNKNKHACFILPSVCTIFVEDKLCLDNQQ